ncbi:MAG: c-type cytochrome [Gemmataceae bacterium]
MTLTFGKKVFFVIYPMVLVASAWYFVPSFLQPRMKAETPYRGVPSHPEEMTGATLFQQNCAYCHGPNGRGNAPAELTIKARWFGIDRFKFANTMNGIPTDENLAAVIKNGIPGSAMPAFDKLSPDQIAKLIEQIRTLAQEGAYTKVEEKLRKDDDFDPVSLQVQVAKTLTPGKVLPIPEFPAVTNESLANGKKLYLAGCASCHGPGGKGDGTQVMNDDDGRPNRPRDLTRGVYKGGGTKADLYTRLMLGVPGTPMPASTTLKPNEVLDVLNYIISLAKEPEAPIQMSKNP